MPDMGGGTCPVVWLVVRGRQQMHRNDAPEHCV